MASYCFEAKLCPVSVYQWRIQLGARGFMEPPFHISKFWNATTTHSLYNWMFYLATNCGLSVRLLDLAIKRTTNYESSSYSLVLLTNYESSSYSLVLLTNYESSSYTA